MAIDIRRHKTTPPPPRPPRGGDIVDTEPQPPRRRKGRRAAVVALSGALVLGGGALLLKGVTSGSTNDGTASSRVLDDGQPAPESESAPSQQVTPEQYQAWLKANPPTAPTSKDPTEMAE